MRLIRRFAPRATRPVPIPFRADFDLASVLGSGGLEVLRTVEEQIEFLFTDEQTWWTWAWSHGMRAVFEALPPSDLEELREEAFSQMAVLRTPEGPPMSQTAVFVVAQKPSSSVLGQPKEGRLLESSSSPSYSIPDASPLPPM